MPHPLIAAQEHFRMIPLRSWPFQSVEPEQRRALPWNELDVILGKPRLPPCQHAWVGLLSALVPPRRVEVQQHCRQPTPAPQLIERVQMIGVDIELLPGAVMDHLQVFHMRRRDPAEPLRLVRHGPQRLLGPVLLPEPAVVRRPLLRSSLLGSQRGPLQFALLRRGVDDGVAHVRRQEVLHDDEGGFHADYVDLGQSLLDVSPSEGGHGGVDGDLLLSAGLPPEALRGEG
mmetsp:Transcript_14013/g.28812  ORF Transcript_14013/g.28812 Transcript_14013/m.28812 type:complete len:230 (-) Transcript_14013:260-949(-)